VATDVDAIVVGSGPNGLAAAITLARAGRSVRVLEAAETIGGGTRTEQLTLPGYLHDTCSAIHPLALASPFLRSLPLAEHGLEFAQPEVALAHPLDGGRAAVLLQSLDATAAGLGEDEAGYRRLMAPLAREWRAIMDDILRPVPRVPRHPLATGRFGVAGLLPAQRLARRRLHSEEGQALLAGCAAHSMQPLRAPGTGAFALMLAMCGHAVGWPAAVGGSQTIANALASLLRTLGGEVETGREVRSLADVRGARAVLFDVPPRLVERISGGALPERFRRTLRRFRYGPGVFKIDYALTEPVPWASDACRRAGTVHLGGTLSEVAASEAEVGAGRIPARPFVLVAQQSLVDTSRAPAGGHTLWAYCHVPNGSDIDMAEAIGRQIERFAPGFRDVVAARHTMTAREVEAHNPSFVGGDINSGAASLWQLLRRPSLRPSPYTTPNPRLVLCGASTPPGGGVHGMCGHLAARAALHGVLR
jgi:phytoene dehydrogenase-like protein